MPSKANTRELESVRACRDGFYRYCNKPNMAHYERTTDDKFDNLIIFSILLFAMYQP